jgi:hypothetical protein
VSGAPDIRRRRKAVLIGGVLAAALATTGLVSQTSPFAASSFLAGLHAQPGTKQITYRAVQFEVPADWPVYRLALDPRRCVRFDVHAVYLGHQGAQPDCPAGLVGRSDAVQVEPLDARSMERVGLTGTERMDAQGRIDRSNPTARELVGALPRLGVLVTIPYTDAALAGRILDSLRRAPGSKAPERAPTRVLKPDRIAA